MIPSSSYGAAHNSTPQASLCQDEAELSISHLCVCVCRMQQAWAGHKRVHVKAAGADWLFCTKRGRGRAKSLPAFPYTGDLRPHRIGPTREVCSLLSASHPKFQRGSDVKTCSSIHHVSRNLGCHASDKHIAEHGQGDFAL